MKNNKENFLNRKPTAEERAKAHEYLAKHPEAYRNIMVRM